MLSVNGYYENGVCVPTEVLELKNRQRVIITVLEDDTMSLMTHDENRIRNALDSFRGKSHIWNGIDPVEYQRKLREERDIVQPHIS